MSKQYNYPFPSCDYETKFSEYFMKFSEEYLHQCTFNSIISLSYFYSENEDVNPLNNKTRLVDTTKILILKRICPNSVSKESVFDILNEIALSTLVT